ncbi:MAG: response regulator, partial [Desulfobacula sp.]
MKTSENEKPAVMIVDDSEIDVDILAECLGDDYRIRVATDSPTALEDIFQKSPDIILLDVMMPVINGYDICKRLKQDDKTKDIPIIFVTSLNEPVDEAMGFELGAVDYINKPFSFSVVRARLKTHLDLANARKKLRLQNKILKENLELRELIEQMIHHDLKNPLQTIMNEAGILMIGDQFKSKHDNIRIILKSCYTISDMINNSSDLYKMEKGQYKTRLEKMDILPVMDRVLSGVQNIIDSKKLEIEFAINEKPRISSHQFEILCDNLL